MKLRHLRALSVAVIAASVMLTPKSAEAKVDYYCWPDSLDTSCPYDFDPEQVYCGSCSYDCSNENDSFKLYDCDNPIYAPDWTQCPSASNACNPGFVLRVNNQ